MATRRSTTSAGATKSDPAAALTAAAFMVKLLDPLPDAELADAEMAKLERKLRVSADEQMKFNWMVGKTHVEIASSRMTIARSERFLAQNLWRPGEAPRELVEAEEAASRAYHLACAAQILIPAPYTSDLRWKRSRFFIKYADHSGSCFCDVKATSAMWAAIAADEARLAKRKKAPEGRPPA